MKNLCNCVLLNYRSFPRLPPVNMAENGEQEQEYSFEESEVYDADGQNEEAGEDGGGAADESALEDPVRISDLPKWHSVPRTVRTGRNGILDYLPLLSLSYLHFHLQILSLAKKYVEQAPSISINQLKSSLTLCYLAS